MADITVTAAQVAAVFSDEGMAEIYDGVAGATITAGQAVYIDSNGQLGVADANAAGRQQFRGIALTGGGAGQAISFITHGCVYGFTLTGNADASVYLSDTAGVLGTTAGTMTVRAGRVYRLSDANATRVLFVEVRWHGNWS